VKKAFGESNFAAVNTNRDGSDNPEGRKYNRRATFGIVDPQTGVIIRQDTYTPEHLRYPSAVKYNIILNKAAEAMPVGYINKLDLNGVLFIRTTETDGAMLYSIGVFYDKSDAAKYLDYVKSKGFTNAYIIDGSAQVKD